MSVLDLVGMHTGESAGSAIARSVDLAQRVERLGYTRFWLAEHHSIEGLACSATAVLIAAICYLYILFYAVSGSKPNSARYGAAGTRS